MNRARRWAPGFVWIALILTATSIPGPDLPPVPDFSGADKIAHCVLYGVLAWLFVRASTEESRRLDRATIFVVAAIALFAAFDERHQTSIPGRAAELSDWVADVIGALGGASLWLAHLRRRETST